MTKNPTVTPQIEPLLVRVEEAARILSLSRSTIYDRISKGTFPAPVSLGVNVVGWPASAVNAWVQQMISDGGKARSPRS